MTDERRFDLPEETEEFRKIVRQIAEERIAPRAAEVDETDEWPKDLWEVLVEHGLMGVGYAEEFGGGGGGSLTFAVMTEELSRVSAGVTLTPLVARLGAIPVMLAGADEQRKELFGGIAEGRHLMSYCLTEPGSGSDAVAMKTRYERTGDGFLLSGTKRFITGAGVSDMYTVFATRDPELRGDGISCFL